MATPALLALSMVSAQATMALFSEEVSRCYAFEQWNNLEGTDLAEVLGEKYRLLFAKNSDFKIIKVFGVEGPGSFTGLRVSSSFLQGVSTALAVPLVGVSSFDLFGEAFAFSLRPAKALSMTLEECIEKEFKFLEVSKDKVETLSIPTSRKILGLKDNPLWPSMEELQQGVKKSLLKDDFILNYGYTPEFKTSVF